MNVTEFTASKGSIILGNLSDYGENVLATVSGSKLNINDTKGGITFSGLPAINH